MKEVKQDILWRVYLVYVAVLIFSFFIIGKVIRIQFVEGSDWKKISAQQTLDTMKVDAIRGNICSDDGSLLTTSVPIFDIFWDAKVVSDDIYNEEADSLAFCLSKMFKDKTKGKYKEILDDAKKEDKEYVLIHRSTLDNEGSQLSYENLKAIKKFPIFRLKPNKGGLIISQKEKRVKPYKMLAKRTLGYIGNDTVKVTKDKSGKVIRRDTGRVRVGVEGYYADDLAGVSGIRLRKKIAGGIWMPMNENEIEPQNGDDVITNIDIDLQDVAENALMKNLILNEADHGCAILMEVSTGYIKAIVNLTKGKDGTYDEEKNYAISEATEPGSTFKLFSMVAGIDDKMVNLDDKVITGKTKYYDRDMKDSHEEGYGIITVRRAFEVSSNVGISQSIFKAYKNDPMRFVKKLYSMRVNLPLVTDITGEASPIVWDPSDRSWSRVTLPWMSIGYEVALTPLQILTFYNAIANNGKMVKPLFARQIQKLGKVIKSFDPVVLMDSICSRNTVKLAQSLLEGVVENGTAKHLKNPVYKIAGKTGTAQVAKNGQGYGKKGEVSYKASFVGYFPVDKPRYSCMVVVNNPSKGAYYGGAVAAPVFKEIADRVYASKMDVPQQNETVSKPPVIPFVSAANQKDLSVIYEKLDFSTITQSPNSEWVSTSINAQKLVMKEKAMVNGFVPDITGMGLKDAIYILEKEGLKVHIDGKGKVVKQSITAGSVIKKGSDIYLGLSKKVGLDAFALDKLAVAKDTLLSTGKVDLSKKANKTPLDKDKVKTDKSKGANITNKNSLSQNKTDKEKNKNPKQKINQGH